MMFSNSLRMNKTKHFGVMTNCVQNIILILVHSLVLLCEIIWKYLWPNSGIILQFTGRD